MKFNLPENLKRAVKSKDLAAARSAILTEVRNDRLREEPRALRLADLASKELPGLYEPDNGFCSSLGDLDVSDDLWTKARSAMMLNFSRERLCFIETIVRKLNCRPNPMPTAESDRLVPDVSRKNSRRKRDFVLKSIAVGVIIILICLVLALREMVKTSPVSVGIDEKQLNECLPVERHDGCLPLASHTALDSANNDRKEGK